MVVWVKSFLEDLGVKVSDTVIHQDNTSTLSLIEKGRATSDTMRHVKIRQFLVKEHVDNGDLRLVHTRTNDMWADLLTKPLQGSLFWQHLRSVSGQAGRRK